MALKGITRLLLHSLDYEGLFLYNRFIFSERVRIKQPIFCLHDSV
jgi:hypothetical protein